MKIIDLFLVFLFSWQLVYSKSSYQDHPTGDLPLHVLEAAGQSKLPVFVFISGDGGWNTFNESLCTNLSRRGFPVVALDSQKYFWKSKTPDQTASVLQGVIETYQKLWKRDRFVLAGYSFGANLIPFLANRLPQNIKNNLAAMILISPEKRGDFEIHLSDMLNLGLSKGKYDVLQEIQQGDVKKYLVLFGSDESESNHQAFLQAGLKTEILQGNHHFDSEDGAVAQKIAEEVKK
jgi:type IV secretory pathway VirJ component